MDEVAVTILPSSVGRADLVAPTALDLRRSLADLLLALVSAKGRIGEKAPASRNLSSGLFEHFQRSCQMQALT